MKVGRVVFGALALSTVSFHTGAINAQGLPQLSTRVDALESRVDGLGEALSGVSGSLARTANSLSRRVTVLEERLEAVEGSLAGFTCPEGQFVRGFNTSGDLLCAAPGPQENPDETIVLDDLGRELRANLNAFLGMSATFPADDVSAEFGLGSLNLTDITLELACSGQCVPTLEATTPGDGTTLIANYDFDGTIEVTGAAEIVIGPPPQSIEVTFVLTYEEIGAGFEAQIEDGSVDSVVSNFSPDMTDLEILDGGELGGFSDLAANLFQSQLNSVMDAFLDDLHTDALGDLEPIDLHRTGT